LAPAVENLDLRLVAYAENPPVDRYLIADVQGPNRLLVQRGL